ncbi:MAG: hypothetical protein LBR08_05525 [Bacteroidales bacterium]|jgi:hypothetical protein|nr:hypothetical protein [Bacteroidales bacterium]
MKKFFLFSMLVCAVLCAVGISLFFIHARMKKKIRNGLFLMESTHPKEVAGNR